jgi:hypothetical protein
MITTAHGNLAKLMSTEDIGVIHGNTKTAYFNTQTRTLCIPNWEGLSDIEVQMLIGHEIGHALYTNHEEWMKAINDSAPNEGIFKRYLNIVEDARIERLVKIKYPGMKKIFFYGYTELLNRELFKFDPANLTFADVINLHFKLNGICDLPSLNEDHRYFIDKIQNADTFDEIVAITKELYAFCKDRSMVPNAFDLGDGETTPEGDSVSEEGDSEDTELSDSDSGAGEEECEDNSEDGSGSSEDEGSEDSEESDGESDKNVGGTEGGGDDTPAPEPTTDDLNENLKSMVSSNKIYYASVPDPIMKNIIIPYKRVIEDFHTFDTKPALYSSKSITEVNQNDDIQDDGFDVDEILDNKTLASFTKKTRSSVAYHKQLFEMRKKANEYNKTMQFRSGVLDMNKCYSYKYNDQIFKTFEVKPNGKKHGLIFFLDMSGSMAGYIKNAIEKMMEIVLFCRATKIPYVVYGFTTGVFHEDYVDEFTNYGSMEYRMGLGNFHLIELMNSSMSITEFKKMFDIIKRLGGWNVPPNYKLGGTPLNETVLCLDTIVNKFKSDTATQVVNVVFFTDGEGHGYNFIDINNSHNYHTPQYDRRPEKEYEYVLHDPKTRMNYSFNNKAFDNEDNCIIQTHILLDVMRNRMRDVNILNYYIVGSTLSFITTEEYVEIFGKPHNEFDWYQRRDNVNELAAKKSIIIKDNYKGFDQVYIIHSGFFDIETPRFKKTEEFASIQELSNKFKTNISTKKSTQKLISNFIDMIV